jgi:hypothetical protein
VYLTLNIIIPPKLSLNYQNQTRTFHLRLVDFAAARVVLHQSAHSRGYKLSREGADPRSLVRGGVCVDVLVR